MKEFTSSLSIHDLIFEAYGIGSPLGSGTASFDDPIIMFADVDFVHNQYEVL